MTNAINSRDTEDDIKEALRRREEELTRLIYSVSHDLKSPLITICGFLDIAEADLNENKQDNLRADFKRIRSAAERMQQLLGGLLELSRIGRMVNPDETVPLNDVVSEALDEMGESFDREKTQIIVDPNLPALTGDRKRIGKAIGNVIANAVHYASRIHPLRIEIGARRDRDETVIYVQDNGIGIKAENLQKVFDLCTRFSDRQFGAGIGLTIAKRVVEYHGGRMWAESPGEGRGSVFFLAFPLDRCRFG